MPGDPDSPEEGIELEAEIELPDEETFEVVRPLEQLHPEMESESLYPEPIERIPEPAKPEPQPPQPQPKPVEAPVPQATTASLPRLSPSADRALKGWVERLSTALAEARAASLDSDEIEASVQAVLSGLTSLHRNQPEITLHADRDRILVGTEALLVDANNADSLPYLLHWSGIRQLRFLDGINDEEVRCFLWALGLDYAGDTLAGANLAAQLWQLGLVHIQYETLDPFALDPEKRATAQNLLCGIDDQEVRRLTQEVDALTALLGNAPSTPVQETDALSNEELWPWLDELREREHPFSLRARAVGLLLRVMRSHGVGESPANGILSSLFGDLLNDQQWEQAKDTLARLSTLAQTDDPSAAAFEQLLGALASETNITRIVEGLRTATSPQTIADTIEILASFGLEGFPKLIDAIDTVEEPHAQRRLCQLVLEYVALDPTTFVEHVQYCNADALRGLFDLSEALSPDLLSLLIWMGSEHEDAALRARSVGLFRSYSSTSTEALLDQHLHDEDARVRMAALRLAAQRRSEGVANAMSTLLAQDETFDQRDDKELQLMLSAFATCAGDEAIPLLQDLLRGAERFKQRRKMTDLRIHAAHLLGSLKSKPAQKAIVDAGKRILNPKIRTACKESLKGKLPAGVVIPKESSAGSKRPALSDRPQNLLPTAKRNKEQLALPEEALEQPDSLPQEALIAADTDDLPSLPPGALVSDQANAPVVGIPSAVTELDPAPTIEAEVAPTLDAAQDLQLDSPAVDDLVLDAPTPSTPAIDFVAHEPGATFELNDEDPIALDVGTIPPASTEVEDPPGHSSVLDFRPSRTSCPPGHSSVLDFDLEETPVAQPRKEALAIPVVAIPVVSEDALELEDMPAPITPKKEALAIPVVAKDELELELEDSIPIVSEDALELEDVPAPITSDALISAGDVPVVEDTSGSIPSIFLDEEDSDPLPADALQLEPEPLPADALQLEAEPAPLPADALSLAPEEPAPLPMDALSLAPEEPLPADDPVEDPSADLQIEFMQEDTPPPLPAAVPQKEPDEPEQKPVAKPTPKITPAKPDKAPKAKDHSFGRLTVHRRRKD